MKPDRESIKSPLPNGTTARGLSKPGEAYAFYFHGGAKLAVNFSLPAGAYKVDWISPKTGETESSKTLDHAGGEATLAIAFGEDIALRIVRTKP
jgi:hypothetical protein